MKMKNINASIYVFALCILVSTVGSAAPKPNELEGHLKINKAHGRTDGDNLLRHLMSWKEDTSKGAHAYKEYEKTPFLTETLISVFSNPKNYRDSNPWWQSRKIGRIYIVPDGLAHSKKSPFKIPAAQKMGGKIYNFFLPESLTKKDPEMLKNVLKDLQWEVFFKEGWGPEWTVLELEKKAKKAIEQLHSNTCWPLTTMMNGYKKDESEAKTVSQVKQIFDESRRNIQASQHEQKQNEQIYNALINPLSEDNITEQDSTSEEKIRPIDVHDYFSNKETEDRNASFQRISKSTDPSVVDAITRYMEDGQDKEDRFYAFLFLAQILNKNSDAKISKKVLNHLANYIHDSDPVIRRSVNRFIIDKKDKLYADESHTAQAMAQLEADTQAMIDGNSTGAIMIDEGIGNAGAIGRQGGTNSGSSVKETRSRSNSSSVQLRFRKRL